MSIATASTTYASVDSIRSGYQKPIVEFTDVDYEIEMDKQTIIGDSQVLARTSAIEATACGFQKRYPPSLTLLSNSAVQS